MQVRFATQGITGEVYVSSRQWEWARLPVCPLHPQGGCGFASHGTYRRVKPAGTQIRRWYCPTGRMTFSALPDCLSARLSGELAVVEAVVRRAEAAPSRARAVRDERPEIGLAGVLRYVDRRVSAVHRCLRAIKGLYPERFGGVEATLTAFAGVLQPIPGEPTLAAPAALLPRLRELAHPYLGQLPAPLGLAPARSARPRTVPAPDAPGDRGKAFQHRMGADPPVIVLDPRHRLGQPA